MSQPNVTDIAGRQQPQTAPGAPTGGNGNGSDLRDRITRIETRLEVVATREDLSKMEIRMLKWGLMIVLGSVSLAIAITKLF